MSILTNENMGYIVIANEITEKRKVPKPVWKAGALPLCYARIECASQATPAVG
jgi:hypothetical protein